MYLHTHTRTPMHTHTCEYIENATSMISASLALSPYVLSVSVTPFPSGDIMTCDISFWEHVGVL